MKRCVLLILFFSLFSPFLRLQAQSSFPKNQSGKAIMQKSFVDWTQGGKLVKMVSTEEALQPMLSVKDEPKSGVLWWASDPKAMPGNVKVTSNGSYSFLGWYLNYERYSLYSNDSSALWSYPHSDYDWEYPVDMLEDGSIMATADVNTALVYANNSNELWEKTFDGTIKSIKLHPDGKKVFIAEYRSDIDSVHVYSYNIETDQLIWHFSLAQDALDPMGLLLSGDGNTLIYRQNTITYLLHSSDGSTITTMPYHSQFMPAISYDGKLFVIQDPNGYIYTYKFKEETQKYVEQWRYKVWDGGQNYLPTIPALAVSDDGSTIAVGTNFYTSTTSDGQVYVFNSFSNVPVWYSDYMGDECSCIDLSSDGSVVAAGSWGPLDNSKPEFYLFRRNSSVPAFTYDTPGSVLSLDLSKDGNVCTIGSKSVHATAWGMGGTVYSINSNLGGGTLSGTATLNGFSDNSGVMIEIPALDAYYDYSKTNGSYSIKYIPAGTYTVKASKVGFYPVIQNNVTVQEGQTINVNFTMQPCGMPPTNLFATQAADTHVNLSWEQPTGVTPVGYNVYRKITEDGLFPAEAIGSVTGGNTLQFIDTTALPFQHYYYAVTSRLNDTLQSPYSSQAEGWMCTGFISRQIDAYQGTTPTIDGIINPGEWNDAFAVDLSSITGNVYTSTPMPIGSVMGYFKVNADHTKLYGACINKNDANLLLNDKVGFYMDDNNDGVFPPVGDDSEGAFTIIYNPSGNYITFRPYHVDGSAGTVFNLPNPEVGVTLQNGFVTYEFAIPIGSEPWEINPGPDNKSRVGIFVKDMPSSFEGWWPYDNQNIYNPAGYGTITVGAVNQTPPPPQNMTVTGSQSKIVLNWDMVDISDFDHFNIYSSTGGNFSLLASTIGVQYPYTLPSTGTYQFYVTTVDKGGLESVPSQTVNYTYSSTGFTLSGTITYPNTSLTPFSNITVKIKNASGAVIGTTSTTASGSYSLNGLTNGNYTLEATTTKTWGGVTAADVLLYKKHIANIALLNGIFLSSGDVNGNGTLSASDVLLVRKRIAAIISSFTTGDWLFNNTAVTISGSNATQNFNGLCYGDANASYTPLAKSSSTKMMMGNLAIQPVNTTSGAITVPVYAADVENLGSFQFTMDYDPSKLTFTGADNWYTGIENVTIGNPVAGKLTFVWAADEKGINLTNDKLFELHFNAISSEASSISWSDIPTAREFGDYDGNIFVPAYANGSIGAITGIENLNNNCPVIYPNPASGNVNIVVTNSISKIEVINYMGMVVYYESVHQNKTISLNISRYSAGSYLVRFITSDGKTITQKFEVNK